ncbi:MAG: hypothetical protein G01um101425_350 [Candidatus Peregrinibacteria bacterium Gr01-1014_25]|nr:MAG: hypothetical protein G01um101425_350 [Candidatus Peregrinibacteria bacterium Gr01-1014_25]
MLRSSLVAIGISTLLFSACQTSRTPVYTTLASADATATGAVFTLRNRDIQMRIAFPKGWQPMSVETGDAMIVMLAPKAAFGIAAYVPSIPSQPTVPIDGTWQRGALRVIRDSLKAKAPAEYEWLGDEEVQLFDRPAIRTTIRQKDGTFVRDTYFLRHNLLFTASFVTEEGAMQTLWPAAEKALRTMQFSGGASEPDIASGAVMMDVVQP